MKTKVVNLKHSKYDVFIGRPGDFGNPYPLWEEKKRESCIESYRRYFLNKMNKDPEFRHKVLALKGKRLGCYCKPKLCHGDIIAEYLENEG